MVKNNIVELFGNFKTFPKRHSILKTIDNNELIFLGIQILEVPRKEILLTCLSPISMSVNSYNPTYFNYEISQRTINDYGVYQCQDEMKTGLVICDKFMRLNMISYSIIWEMSHIYPFCKSPRIVDKDTFLGNDNKFIFVDGNKLAQFIITQFKRDTPPTLVKALITSYTKNYIPNVQTL